ncbi:MAG: hypothetical protein OHK0039_14730 [Bacteroidia bacterium]
MIFKHISLTVLICSLFAGTSLLAQQPIPTFAFQTLDGKPFDHTQVDLRRPAVIIRFDPYCDHCEQQAAWIAGAAASFKDIQLIFVSFIDEPEAIASFQQRYFGKTDLPLLHFLRDPDYQFEEFFGYTNDALNIYLYKPGQKRLKYFGHEQEAATLLKFL